VGALVALVGLVALGGCVENRDSVTILQMQTPSSDCSVTGGGGSFISMGRLDVWNAFDDAAEYFMFPLVQNNLLSTASTNDVERNYIEIIEARVELDFGALGASLDADTARFRYPAFKTLAPGESATLQVLGVPAVTARVLANLLPSAGDSVIVRARLKFLYQHGEYERVTHTVEFPILVGRYVLFPRPEETVTCDSGLVPDTVSEGNGCNPYQDTPIDCCVSGSTLVCPAVDTSDTGTL
jgi:hypothetical protein